MVEERREKINNPLISVIVPVYNVEKYLERCVDSICGQTYKNLEIILVIDGEMDDSSAEIAYKKAKNDGRIKIIEQVHAGPGAARNKGIGAANGELLGFVDSDDWIEPDMYEKLLNSMRIDHRIDLSICGYYTENGIRTGSMRRLLTHNSELSMNECFEGVYKKYDVLKDIAYGKVSSYAWNKLYKLKLFEIIRYPEAANFEDVAIIYRLVNKCERIAYVPIAGYHYVRRKKSIISARCIPDYLDSLQVYLNRHRVFVQAYPEFHIALCRSIYDSAISLTAACVVSGKKMREAYYEKTKILFRKMYKVLGNPDSGLSGLQRVIVTQMVRVKLDGYVAALMLEKVRRMKRKISA